MTQSSLKQEIADVKASIDSGLIPAELLPVVQANLNNLETELAKLEKGSSSSTPAPPSVKKDKKEKTDEEKAAFAEKMKEARAAKAAERAKQKPTAPTDSEPAPKPKSKGIGTHLGTAKIDCDFEIFQNDTGATVHVPNVNGPMEAKNGDYVLYLPEDGESFTVIKKSMFGKRCTVVTAATKPSVQAWTPPPTEQPKEQAKEQPKSEPKPEPKPEQPKEQPKGHAHEAAKQVVKEMTKQGCDVHTFLKETKNTPLDAWVQGKIIDYTTGKTDEWIERIYIDQEHGDFYAKIKFKSAKGWFTLPRYVKVCPERGIETIVDAKMVEGKKYRVQYGQDKLRALYHYPEDITGCRSLAKEIYEIRLTKGDSSGKYQSYVNRCQNPQWQKQYGGFIRWMHSEASDHRKKRPTMSHGEALKVIANELRIAAE